MPGLKDIKNNISTVDRILRLIKSMHNIAKIQTLSARKKINRIIKNIENFKVLFNPPSTFNQRFLCFSDYGFCGDFNSLLKKEVKEDDFVLGLKGKYENNFLGKLRNPLTIQKILNNISLRSNISFLFRGEEDLIEIKLSDLFYNKEKIYRVIKEEVEEEKTYYLKESDEDFSSKALRYLFIELCLNISIFYESNKRIKETSIAKKNTEEMISKLKTKYSSLNQSIITNEILDIINGIEKEYE